MKTKKLSYHLSYFANWLKETRFVEKYFDYENQAVDETKRVKMLGADNIKLSKCYKQKIDF